MIPHTDCGRQRWRNRFERGLCPRNPTFGGGLGGGCAPLRITLGGGVGRGAKPPSEYNYAERLSAKHGRLRRRPARSQVAERGAARRELRDELRGGIRVLRARRRRLLGGLADRDRGRRSRCPGPRSRRRVDVRVRQPRRLLARAAPLPRAAAVVHRVRVCPRPRAQPAGGGGARRARRRRVLPRLAVDQALRALRGRRAPRHRPRRAIARVDGGAAAARLVLPVRPKPAHAATPRRGGRLPLRLRRLQRRAAVLAGRRRPAAPGRPIYPRAERREVRARAASRRPTISSPT